MISKQRLAKNIQNEFPRIRKPFDYAEVILTGIKIKSTSITLAKKRKNFLASGKIKPHIFASAYIHHNLLIPIRRADKNIVVVSARRGFLFNYSLAFGILNFERSRLYAHILSEPRVKSLVTMALKIPNSSPISKIKSVMGLGDLMKQAGVYDKVFRSLDKNNIRPKGYAWFGVRSTPVSKYYLSDKSKTLLKI